MEGCLFLKFQLFITVGVILFARCQGSSYVSRLASGPLVLPRLGDSGDDDVRGKSALGDEVPTPSAFSSFSLPGSTFSHFGKPPPKRPLDDAQNKKYPEKPYLQWYPKKTDKPEYDHHGYDEYW